MKLAFLILYTPLHHYQPEVLGVTVPAIREMQPLQCSEVAMFLCIVYPLALNVSLSLTLFWITFLHLFYNWLLTSVKGSSIKSLQLYSKRTQYQWGRQYEAWLPGAWWATTFSGSSPSLCLCFSGYHPILSMAPSGMI